MSNALAIGTLIFNLYVVQEVVEETNEYILYSVENVKTKKKQLIKEFFPTDLVVRSEGVLNVIIPDNEKGAQFYNMEERFIEVAEIIKHFNSNDEIEVIVGTFKQNGTAYIVIEPYEGDTLNFAVNRKGTLTVKEALAGFLPVIKILSNINTVGVFHKLINPKNIMYYKQKIKLINFGYCLGEDLLDAAYLPAGVESKDLETKTWSDTYSIAATLYFAITGRVPQNAEEHMEHNTLVPPSAIADNIPSEFEMLLMRILKNEDKDAPLSEFYKELSQLEIDIATREQKEENEAVAEMQFTKRVITQISNVVSRERTKQTTLAIVAVMLSIVFAATCFGIILTSRDSAKIEKEIEKYEYLKENSGFKIAFDLASVMLKGGTVYTGLVTENETATFFEVPTAKTNLFKIDKKNIIEAIANINCVFMYATEEDIYFSNVADNYKLYKVSVEGKNIQQVNDTKTMFSVFYEPNNTIYYTNADDTYKLYKHDFNTGKTGVVVNHPSFSLYLYEDTIYYARGDESYSLYAYNIKTNETQKLQEGPVKYPRINGDIVYYINGSGQISIYNLETENTTLYDKDANAIMMDMQGDQIVYLNKDKEMVSLSTETKEKEVISKDTVDYLDITKHGIIYLKNNRFVLRNLGGDEIESYLLASE